MNIYEPSEDDILSWAFSDDPKWPAADWDFYVLRNPNEELIIKLANDKSCPKNKFFLHALYYFVGDSFTRPFISEERRERINSMLSHVKSDASPELLIWKRDVEQLLSSEVEFDNEKWLHFMFNE